jgi:hypothetical protein
MLIEALVTAVPGATRDSAVGNAMPSQNVESALWPEKLQSRIDELIDDCREALHDCLDGLTEDEARRSPRLGASAAGAP